MFINVLPIVLIDLLEVYQVENLIFLNVLLRIIIGHSSKRKSFVSENFHFFVFRFTGEKIKKINLGSYNYLGFANNDGPILDHVINSIQTNGIATASTTQEFGNSLHFSFVSAVELFILGTLIQHRKLESLLAEFLGTEDAIAFGMGFATNALNIPSIVGKVNKDKEQKK